MKRTKVDAGLEKQFLIGMVTSTPFLAGCALSVDTTLFPARYCQLVSDWCITHFKRYGTSPGKDLTAVYHAWVENEHPSDEDADAVSTFLESISDLHDTAPEINVPFLTQELGRYMTLRGMEKLKEQIEFHLLKGEADAGLEAVQNFRSPQLSANNGYTLTKSALARAFAAPVETLIHFPGAGGEFFGPALTRDSLIAIQAPEKRGKTNLTLEFGFRGLRSGKKVAIFQTGDLSEAQLTKRIAIRMAGIPLWKSQCAGVDYPISIEIEKEGNDRIPVVKTAVRTFPEPINLANANVGRKLFNRRYRLDGTELKLSVHPNNSINVAGINAILQRWKYEEGWVADVILVDYADILAPETFRKESRDQVNETWQALRRLSQEWHACVITATQANAASYQTKTQGMQNFSNDKRKLAHVTGLCAINQTHDEKKLGVVRLNWIVLRESEFSPDRCLWIAQCIPLGQAYVKGVW